MINYILSLDVGCLLIIILNCIHDLKMTSLLELCRKYFNTGNLYEVLNTKKDATDKEG